MDIGQFVNTFIDRLPEPLRSSWAHMEPYERALRIHQLLLRTAGPEPAEPAFAATRAMQWLSNAHSSCPEPHAVDTAARMTAQVVMMTELR
jgi:hypothetical protein